MDGPNVNHKFYREYVSDRETNLPNAPELLNLGSCGLHIIHGAFKTGASATGWKLDNLLRSLWYLFCDSPARREDFTTVTGSTTFPLQFCSTRWIEDAPVAERAVEIWKDVCTYIESVEKKPKYKRPNSTSYIAVLRATNDPLTLSKLLLFIDVAKLFTPFLRDFQTDKPMCPFLGTELSKLTKEIFEKFVKSSVMGSVTMSNITEVELKDENLKAVKDVQINFAAKEALKAIGASDAKTAEFKQDCKTLFKSIAVKLIQRSPLQFKIVRDLDCLNPRKIAMSEGRSLNKFESLLSHLCKLKMVNVTECDELVKEYKKFTSVVHLKNKDEFKEYDYHGNVGVDNFLYKHIKISLKLCKLWELMKTLLILSHGQASVERGFSVNKEILSTNLGKKSMIAQRIVTDAVKAELNGNVHNIDELNISPKMITSCSAARMRYATFTKSAQEIKLREDTLKRKMALDSDLLMTSNKRAKLESRKDRLIEEANSLARDAEEKSSFKILSDSNTLRKEADNIQSEIESNLKKIMSLKMQLKELRNY
jgi:hypothetical protein